MKSLLQYIQRLSLFKPKEKDMVVLNNAIKLGENALRGYNVLGGTFFYASIVQRGEEGYDHFAGEYPIVQDRKKSRSIFDFAYSLESTNNSYVDGDLILISKPMLMNLVASTSQDSTYDCSGRVIHNYHFFAGVQAGLVLRRNDSGSVRDILEFRLSDAKYYPTLPNFSTRKFDTKLLTKDLVIEDGIKQEFQTQLSDRIVAIAKLG